MMHLGIGSYTYVWAIGVPGYPSPAQPLTALALLDKATALGVRVVQIADNLPLHRLTANELNALSERADELGLMLEVGTGGIDAANLHGYIAIAQQLRSPILRT